MITLFEFDSFKSKWVGFSRLVGWGLSRYYEYNGNLSIERMCQKRAYSSACDFTGRYEWTKAGNELQDFGIWLLFSSKVHGLITSMLRWTWFDVFALLALIALPLPVLITYRFLYVAKLQNSIEMCNTNAISSFPHIYKCLLSFHQLCTSFLVNYCWTIDEWFFQTNVYLLIYIQQYLAEYMKALTKYQCNDHKEKNNNLFFIIKKVSLQINMTIILNINYYLYTGDIK